jgi:hypothetical protein
VPSGPPFLVALKLEEFLYTVDGGVMAVTEQELDEYKQRLLELLKAQGNRLVVVGEDTLVYSPDHSPYYRPRKVTPLDEDKKVKNLQD